MRASSRSGLPADGPIKTRGLRLSDLRQATTRSGPVQWSVPEISRPRSDHDLQWVRSEFGQAQTCSEPQARTRRVRGQNRPLCQGTVRPPSGQDSRSELGQARSSPMTTHRSGVSANPIRTRPGTSSRPTPATGHRRHFSQHNHNKCANTDGKAI